MQIIIITHFISAVLMIAIPVGLATILTRRFKIGWGIWWLGGVTFIASQVGHIPFNIAADLMCKRNWLPIPPQNWRLVFSATFLGLSAGLWENWFRYIAYRWWVKVKLSYRRGLLLGAGHGGMEAILVGFISLYSLFNIWFLHGRNIADFVPADRIPLIEQQLETYWSLSWYMPFLGVAERVFTIIFHITASVIVLQAFTRGKIIWVWFAVGWHALMDGVFAVYLPAIWRGYPWWPLAVEGLLGGLALFNLVILYLLRQPEPTDDEGPPPDLPGPVRFDQLPQPDDDRDLLDRTRFSD